VEGAALRLADLEGADLRWADLAWADLERANLEDACLTGANLEWADLEGAKLVRADLENAKLRWANLEGSDLRGATIRNADLAGVRTAGTIFQNVTWRPEDGRALDPKLVKGFDVRGIRYSDPLFDQFVRESEFIRACQETWPKWVFGLWKVTCDCGRSLKRWLLMCALMIGVFATVFGLAELLGSPIIRLGASRPTLVSNLYYSVVTFGTLGFGDIVPTCWIGQVVVMIEVFLGYVFLGGAISIFTTKFIPPR